MKKLNCWEFKKCGREPGGSNSAGGLCPAAVAHRTDGINNGHNGGRCCWAIPESDCIGALQNTIVTCLQCEVLAMVQEQESVDFVLLGGILNRIK